MALCVPFTASERFTIDSVLGQRKLLRESTRVTEVVGRPAGSFNRVYTLFLTLTEARRSALGLLI
jgi:hypothetical protein